MNYEEKDILSEQLSGEETKTVEDELDYDGSYSEQEGSFHNYELPAEGSGSVINKSLIIATAILGAFIVAFSAYMFLFNQSADKMLKNSELTGSWLHRMGDTATYYNFSDDGVLTITSGTFQSVSGFAIDSADKNKFLIYNSKDYTESDSAVQSLNFEVYKDDDNIKTVRIYSESSASYELIMQNSDPVDIKQILKPDENFQAVKEIVGSWENKDYNLYFTFDDDGYISLDFGNSVYNGIYTADKSKVEFTYSADFEGKRVNTDYFNYEVDGDTFVFYTGEIEEGSGYTFTRVSE